MDRRLKRIQRDRPAAFCCRDFSLLHDNSPAHTAASFFLQIFDPKNVTILYHPHTVQIYLRQAIFRFPS